MIPNPRDEFAYKLQTKDEVRKQIATMGLDRIDCKVTTKYYTSYENRPLAYSRDSRSAVAKAVYDLKGIHFAPLQRRRLVYLMGTRMKGNKIKLVCRRYQKFGQNLEKIREMFKEVIIEALRAPQTKVDVIYNPYIRAQVRAREKELERQQFVQSLAAAQQALMKERGTIAGSLV